MSEGLKHYGTPRHSGRYPWGSGDNPQRNKDFRARVIDLRKQGMSDAKIAEGFGMNSSKFRAKMTIGKAEQRKEDYAMALRLKDKGYSNVKIGELMGINESSVRSLLDPALQERSEIAETIANTIKDAVEKKKYIDVGIGTERHLGVTRTKQMVAVAMLEEEGYKVHKFDIDQVGTGKPTNMMVVTKGDVGYAEVLANKDKIRMVEDHYSEDGGRTMLGIEPPKSISSKRIKVNFAEDGGTDKDGVIELRRGVPDLSLGQKKYAQVRIAVDDTHYLKGMAMYNDDMPAGIDVIFNTNKKREVGKMGALKPLKRTDDGEIDPDNPFGATIKQRHYVDSKGQKHLSSINIVSSGDKLNEEGRWGEWSKSLSSQVLSKQNPSLAKKQLDLAYNIKREEYDEIMALDNPAIKKKLLESFADDCDSSAVHLKAAALPRQKSHVILPLPDIKENEVYAPGYNNGERVVLIRHPHGGTFEIPELIVNNRTKYANAIKNAEDGVGIHPKVAERLSGADFDGDTVLVIPNNHGLIKTSSPLKGLENFDPKLSYKIPEGNPNHVKVMDTKGGGNTQHEMGNISNLITDMTIKGATPDELAKAVRHSMVVIDAAKHGLDYEKSYNDNGIAALKLKYQGKKTGGASTLISRASSDKRVYDRKLKINTSKMTPEELAAYNEGQKIYEYTGKAYVRRTVKDSAGREARVYKDPKTKKLMFIDNVNGARVRTEVGDRPIKETEKPVQIKSTKMMETDDAFTLSSGTTMEAVYATHANKLKALANTSRKEAIATKPTTYSPSAKKTYAREVASLQASLNVALKNAPLERQAQLLANSWVASKRSDNPDMDNDELKKVKAQALAEARSRVGAKKERIPISPREWEAIQAGAISNSTLTKIISNMEQDKLKELATPRTSGPTLTPAKLATAKSRLASGYTQAEVAESLGISTSALLKAMKAN